MRRMRHRPALARAAAVLRPLAAGALLACAAGGALAFGPPALPALPEMPPVPAVPPPPAAAASAPSGPAAAALPSGEVLRTPGLALRWDLLEPQRAGASPARVEGAVEAPLGRVRSTLRVDPATPLRAARLATSFEAAPGAPLPKLVVGDTVGSGAAWSAPAPLGGLRFGRVAAPRVPGTVLAPLPPGAADWEVEAGRLRSEPSPGVLHYGDAYGAAAWRVGLAPGLTAQARSEWAGERQAGGIEFAQAAGPLGTLQASWAQSATTGREDPTRWTLGLARGGSGPGWLLAVDASGRGWTPAVGETGRRAGAKLGTGLPLGPRSRVDVDLQKVARWDQPQADTQLTVATRTALARRGMLVVALGQRTGNQPGWRAGLALHVAL